MFLLQSLFPTYTKGSLYIDRGRAHQHIASVKLCFLGITRGPTSNHSHILFIISTNSNLINLRPNFIGQKSFLTICASVPHSVLLYLVSNAQRNDVNLGQMGINQSDFYLCASVLLDFPVNNSFYSVIILRECLSLDKPDTPLLL